MKLKYFAAALSAVVFMACASVNPVTRAETLGQKSYALYGLFVVYEEQAAIVVQDPNVPDTVKAQLKYADFVAKPVADKLLAATLAVDAVRSDLAAGKTTEEKLAIANANLARWYTDVRPKVEDLVSLVQGARK